MIWRYDYRYEFLSKFMFVKFDMCDMWCTIPIVKCMQRCQMPNCVLVNQWCKFFARFIDIGQHL
jgi:hypothetical protein